MSRKSSGGCLLCLIYGIVLLPFVVLGELMKPKNLYHYGRRRRQ